MITNACWVCLSGNTALVREKTFSAALSSSDFAITDSRYGMTLALFSCSDCGFLFCANPPPLEDFYAELEDQEYELGRPERKREMSQLMNQISRIKRSGTLLDIGAGSGILIEVARGMGYDASGIEPSVSLQQKAAEKNLPVQQGTFETMSDPLPNYDVITMIDVIEHLANPRDLLSKVRSSQKSGSLLCISTPDVSSLARRILGWKWWHFRIAHVGYFDRSSLDRLMGVFGYRRILSKRPVWYFKISYVLERLLRYLPVIRFLRLPETINGLALRVNLRDSIFVIYEAA